MLGPRKTVRRHHEVTNYTDLVSLLSDPLTMACSAAEDQIGVGGRCEGLASLL
jgi:hypothetical protein